MTHILHRCTPEDYRFLVGLCTEGFRLTDGTLLTAFQRYEKSLSPEDRAEVDRLLLEDIGYLGSADLAYWTRRLGGKPGGVPFDEMVRDVAKYLEVRLPREGTIDEHLALLATSWTRRMLVTLPPEQVHAFLDAVGVEEAQAWRLLGRTSAAFSVPLLLSGVEYLLIHHLVRGVLLSNLTRFLGQRISNALLGAMVSRFPWWTRWIVPAAWVGSLSFTLLDLQGPAFRKTVPVVLYLGSLVLRDAGASGSLEAGEVGVEPEV